MTTIHACLLAIAVIISLLALWSAKLMYRLQCSLRDFRYHRRCDSNSSLDGDSFSIAKVGDRQLQGTFFPSRATTRLGTVLFAHELGGNRWSVVPYLDIWRNAGFDVAAIDFPHSEKGHDCSQPTDHPWVTRADVNDLLSAIDYLCNDRACRDVLLMGVSRGGLMSLCAAARDDRVSAVIVDSCYLCDDLVAHYIREQSSVHSRIGPYLMKFVPDAILRWHARFALKRILGKGCDGYSEPRRLLRGVTQPVLIVHGKQDRWVPFEVATSLARHLRNASLWIVDGAEHRTSIHVSPSEYESRLRRFVCTDNSDAQVQLLHESL